MKMLARYLAERSQVLEILFGLGLIVAGTALLSAAAAFIAAGAGIITFSVWSGWKGRR